MSGEEPIPACCNILESAARRDWLDTDAAGAQALSPNNGNSQEECRSGIGADGALDSSVWGSTLLGWWQQQQQQKAHSALRFSLGSLLPSPSCVYFLLLVAASTT